MQKLINEELVIYLKERCALMGFIPVNYNKK